MAPTSTRQVARAVALLYLVAVAVVVALSGGWASQMAAIVTLLAVGTLLVVLFMDLVPPGVLGRWRRPAEGLGAVVFLGLLTMLTGGAGSPFFVGFFLVVAGTALSTEGRAPLAIALLAATTVALVGIVGLARRTARLRASWPGSASLPWPSSSWPTSPPLRRAPSGTPGTRPSRPRASTR